MVIRILATLVIIIIAGYTMRWWRLARQSHQLYKTSQTFETDYVVGDHANPQITYLILGDSTGFGTGATTLEGTYPYQIARHLASKGKYVHVVNLSRYGARMSDVIAKQLPQVTNYSPNIVTLEIGANDATHFTSSKNYKKSIEAMKATLPKDSAQVLWANTPDMAKTPALSVFAGLIGARAKKQNEILANNLKSTSIQLADIYADAKLDEKELYASDLFHPSDLGYQKWAETFIKKL